MNNLHISVPNLLNSRKFFLKLYNIFHLQLWLLKIKLQIKAGAPKCFYSHGKVGCVLFIKQSVVNREKSAEKSPSPKYQNEQEP